MSDDALPTSAQVPSIRGRLVAASLVLFVVFLIGTFGYYALGSYTFGHGAWALGDCAYMTVITLTTVGYGEILDVRHVPGGRLFTSVLLFTGLGTAVYFASALTTFLVEGEFQHFRSRRKMKHVISNMKDHIIVCGVGAHGASVIEELVATQWPVIAVERDPANVDHVRERVDRKDLPAVIGDATEDTVLLEAGIERARGLITSLPEDRDNVFVVLTSRVLNPKLKIVAKAEKQKTWDKLRKAGADSVVTPSHIGGVRMVSEMIRPQVVEFLDLMLRDRDKNLRIEEVVLAPGSKLDGKPLAEARIREKTNMLVLAVREPQGQFLYNPDPTLQLRAGMSMIVLGATDSVQVLRRAAGRGFDLTGPHRVGET